MAGPDLAALRPHQAWRTRAVLIIVVVAEHSGNVPFYICVQNQMSFVAKQARRGVFYLIEYSHAVASFRGQEDTKVDWKIDQQAAQFSKV